MGQPHGGQIGSPPRIRNGVEARLAGTSRAPSLRDSDEALGRERVELGGGVAMLDDQHTSQETLVSSLAKQAGAAESAPRRRRGGVRDSGTARAPRGIMKTRHSSRVSVPFFASLCAGLFFALVGCTSQAPGPTTGSDALSTDGSPRSGKSATDDPAPSSRSGASDSAGSSAISAPSAAPSAPPPSQDAGSSQPSAPPDMQTGGDDVAACYEHCMAATPSSKAFFDTDLACLEGCADNDTACFDACNKNFDQACTADPTSCDRFVSCSTNCDPSCSGGTC
jgi:hypothetical protein